MYYFPVIHLFYSNVAGMIKQARRLATLWGLHDPIVKLINQFLTFSTPIGIIE